MSVGRRHRAETSWRFLRIAVGQELHRVLQVGKEDGDLLTLALQGPLEVRIFSAKCLGV